jgi:hypothetical protein
MGSRVLSRVKFNRYRDRDLLRVASLAVWPRLEKELETEMGSFPPHYYHEVSGACVELMRDSGLERVRRFGWMLCQVDC